MNNTVPTTENLHQIVFIYLFIVFLIKYKEQKKGKKRKKNSAILYETNTLEPSELHTQLKMQKCNDYNQHLKQYHIHMRSKLIKVHLY